MKKNNRKSLTGLCLLATFLMCGVIFANAQTGKMSAKAHSKQVWETIFAARQNAPFFILTPEDLKNFSDEQIRAFIASLDPCETALPISYGQTINGQLSNTDCRLPDNSYADFYSFNGNQGDQVTINLSSAAFDTYLGLANESGTFVIEDDDGGGGTNSRITATLPQSGLYIILANSVFSNQFGNYTLNLTGGPPCTFVFTPNFMQIPAAGGSFSFSVTTPPHCQWTATTFDSFIMVNGSGTGSGTVNFTVAANPTNIERTGSIRIGNQFFNLRQDGIECNYVLTPSSINNSAAATSGSFEVSGPAGCFWSVRANGYFITANGSGTGNGTVNYSVQNNNGADRVGTISIGNQLFTINQAGLNCTYTVTPTEINAPRIGMSGTVNINTQPGCTWVLTRNQLWINVQGLSGPGISGSGQAAIPYTIEAQPDPQSRSGAIQVFYSLNGSSNSTTVWIEQNGTFNNPKFDFNGNGKADLAVFRPSNGVWYMQISEIDYSSYQFGLETDVIAPADYNGDGRTDIAVFRPSNGVWYLNVIQQGPTAIQFGAAGDIPVPADYDGDGKADLAVFRPSNGVWYIRRSSDNQFTFRQFGLAEDIPTLGDFDGDGKADLALWRPSTGVWYRLNSSNDSFYAFQFGLSEDKPVPADYDGDGKSDIAVWRPSTGVWYRINSADGSFYAEQFGLSEDLPAAADYDGDGKTDIAVFRPSSGVWYLKQSTNGFAAKQYGLDGDKPWQNAFIR